MIRRSAAPRRFLLPALLLTLPLALGSRLLAAEGKERRELDVRAIHETRKVDGREISRDRFETCYTVIDRRGGELTVTVPWSSITLKDATGNHDASSMQDVSLDLELPMGRSDGDRQLRFLGGLNLPTGQDSLDADEALAVEAISPSNEDWDDPALGRGFNLSLGASLLVGAKALTSWEGRFLYTYMGSFDYTAQAVQDARSMIDFELEADHRPGDGKAWTFAFRVSSLSDETLTTGRGPSRTVDVQRGATDLEFRVEREVEMAPGSRVHVELGWNLRGEGDYVEADGTSHADVDLGDRLDLRAYWHHDLPARAALETGLTWRSTDESTDGAGAPIFDSERRALSWSSRWEKKGAFGGDGTLRVGLDLGLSDDAPDALVSLGGLLRF